MIEFSKAKEVFFSLLLPVHEHINRFLTKLHRYPHLFHAIFIYIYGKVKHSILPHKCAYSKLYYVFHWFFFSSSSLHMQTSHCEQVDGKRQKKKKIKKESIYYIKKTDFHNMWNNEPWTKSDNVSIPCFIFFTLFSSTIYRRKKKLVIAVTVFNWVR